MRFIDRWSVWQGSLYHEDNIATTADVRSAQLHGNVPPSWIEMKLHTLTLLPSIGEHYEWIWHRTVDTIVQLIKGME